MLRSLRVSPKHAQRKREKIPQQRSLGRRQRDLVTILACQSNFILSVPFGTGTRHDAPCSQANAVSAGLSSRRPQPPGRAAAALTAQTRAALPPLPPVRATRATKGAQLASSERGRRRLLPTPLRDVRLSCLCLGAHTPFLKSQGSSWSEIISPTLEVIGETTLSS